MQRRANRCRRPQNFGGALRTICAAVGFATLNVCVAWADPTYSLVKIPGAYWTILTGINKNGFAVGGYTYDKSGNPEHLLVRSPDGTVTTFDPPGSTNTYSGGINDSGATTGEYFDSTGGVHGFIRTLDGGVTSFDVPGAKYTIGVDINNNNEVSGWYKDFNYVVHGFVRSADGSFTTFDALDSVETATCCINKNGLVAGIDHTPDKFLGLIRRPTGKIITFAVVTRAGTKDTFVQELNNHGTVVGYFSDDNVAHGFVRAATGEMRIVDVPGARATLIGGINNEDTSVGEYEIIGGRHPVYGAFIRMPDGTIETFSVPNHETKTTGAVAVNDSGAIVGDVGSQAFVRTP